MTRLIDLYILIVSVGIWLSAVFGVAALVERITGAFVRGAGAGADCRGAGGEMAEMKDLTDRVFGRWTVLMQAPFSMNKAGDRYWLCLCELGDTPNARRLAGGSYARLGDTPNAGRLASGSYVLLGTLRFVVGKHLLNGHSRSCGCLQREIARGNLCRYQAGRGDQG